MKSRRVKAMALVAVLAGSLVLPLAGCKKNVVVIDKTKTQLYISNYDAGIGRTWIEAIGASFEEDFKNYSFEEGKTGVQVLCNHNRVSAGTTLEAAIAGYTDYVFFTEGIDYPSMVSKNLIHDVSDIMNEGAITGVDANNNFIREEKSIKEKIDPNFLDYLDRNATEAENYYAFPYYLALKGMIYDKDLWDTNSYYIAKNGAPSETIAQAVANGGDVEAAIAACKADTADGIDLALVNAKGERSGTTFGLSAGPDGQYGTSDDGLPATLEEFYALMEVMKTSVAPFIWSGKNPGYADMATNTIWWNYEGAENLRAYYSLNGTIDTLVKLDANGNIIDENLDGIPDTESKTFDGGKTDGYEAQRMLGKYYALQFAQKIASHTDWLSPYCDNTTISHISAQAKFLTSCLDSYGDKRIAMLIDGGWWQQEADETFTIMESSGSQYSKANRNLSMLAAPNATAERYAERAINEEKNIMVSQNDAFCFINGNLAEGSAALAVSKAFMSYVNSDKMLNLFQEKTNMARALNYEIDDATYERLSVYGKNLVDYSRDTQIVYHYTNNELFIKNYAYLSNTSSTWNWHSKTWDNKTEVWYPISSMRVEGNIKNGLNAATYFAGLYHYQKDTVWGRLI